MSIKILAYSTDLATLETLTTWAAQTHPVELQVIQSLEQIPELLDDNQVGGLILDESDKKVSFTELRKQISQLKSGIRVLLIRSQKDENIFTQSFPPEAKILHKPISRETLQKTFSNLLEVDLELTGSENTRAEFTTEKSDAEDDLSYLKEWIGETPPDEPDTDNFISTPQTTPVEDKDIVLAEDAAKGEPEGDESSSVLTDQGKNAGGMLFANHNAVEAQTAITPRTPIKDKIIPSQPFNGHAQDTATLDKGSDESLHHHYTFVLIPRDSRHYLTRSIAERLGMILPWIHASRGWRITGISIRPQHVQWSVTLPEEITPLAAIQEIRTLTSEQLYASFSELKSGEENQEFWSPGYLALSGTRPMPHSMIKAFMDYTREYQSRETNL